MCLLIFAHRVVPGLPLVVAANRDEFLARPTDPMTVLHAAAPHLRGGRDLEAGGSWMSTAESGLVIALTNQPGGRFPGRKSRGNLPLALAGTHDTKPANAQQAIERARALRPADYNPCWLLIADREHAFYVDMTGAAGAPDEPVITPLEPGVHVLENRPLNPPSTKAALVQAKARRALQADDLTDALFELLASHQAPAHTDLGQAQPDQTDLDQTDVERADLHRPDDTRPDALMAPCVHYGPYGTRSAAVVTVPLDGPPTLHYTLERPCDALRKGEVSQLRVVPH